MVAKGISREHCCTANNSINTDKFQTREVGVYSVGCSGYGYLFFSHSHNMKISREIDINKKADCFKHKHKTKNRSRHKQKVTQVF